MRKEETTMTKTFLNLIVASLIAATTTQIVSASERHHAAKTDRTASDARFRNSNAYAAPAVQLEAPRYGGGISAPAGH
jgi:hypothetical protein